MQPEIHPDVSELILSQDDIKAINERLGKQISHDYAGKNPVLVCVLKGAFIFASDLMRQLSIPASIDFICVSSYGSRTTSSGEIIVRQELTASVEGKDVIIVEDMFDTGLSLGFLRDYLARQNPKSIKIASLLVKTGVEHKVDFLPDYIGHKMVDGFVVGYGLDFDEYYRNLPYVGILRPSVYGAQEKD